MTVRTAVEARTRARTTPWWVRPLALWLAWRLAHLVLMHLVGGPPGRSWDDGYYRTILRQGYRPFEPYGVWQQTNFFPLLPWVTRVVQAVVRSETVAIHTVLTVAQIAAVLLLYEHARRLRDERVALTAVAILLVAPPSVFLWLFFSEGLFLALSMAAMLCAARGRHGWAALFGVGVAMTRTVGVLIVVPLALWRLQRREPRGRLWLACMPVVGVFVVMLAQWLQADDPLGFVHASEHWGRRTTSPLTTFFTRIDHALETGVSAGVLLDVVAVLLVCAAGVVAMRRPYPWAERAWLWLMMLAPLASGLAFSWARYAMSAWPAYVVGAEVAQRRPLATRVAAAVLLAILTVQRLLVWHSGRFIG